MSEKYPTRMVRDTRVSAFTYGEAVQYLIEQNHMYYPLTWEAWSAICHQPNDELIQAYDDYFVPKAYMELQNNYAEMLD